MNYTLPYTTGLQANLDCGPQAGFVDNTAIPSLPDISGHSNAFSVLGGPAPAFESALFHGHGGIQFGSGRYLGLDASALDLSAGGYTFVFVIDSLISAYGPWLAKGNSNQRIAFYTGELIERYSDLRSHFAENMSPCVISYTFAPSGNDVGTETLRINGQFAGSRTGAVPSWNPSDIWVLGCNNSASLTYKGALGAVLAYDHLLASDDLAAVENALIAHFEIGSMTGDIRLVIDANSLGVQSLTTYADTVFGYCPDGWRLLAYSGRSLETMITDHAAGYYGPVVPGKKNAAMVIEAQNSLPTYGSADAWFNAYVGLLQDLKDEGMLPIAWTLEPSSFYSPTVEAQRLDINQRLRDLRDSGNAPFVYLCDVASDPNIGQAGDNLDTTYYVDGTHMTPAGYAIRVTYMYTALDFIANTTFDAIAPAAPILSVARGDGHIWLSAVAPADLDVTAVKFFRDGTEIADVSADPEQTVTFDDTGLTNGQSYLYTAKALDGAGNESELSNNKTITPRAAGGEETMYFTPLGTHSTQQLLGTVTLERPDDASVLQLQCLSPETRIRYTLDGSQPTATHGFVIFPNTMISLQLADDVDVKLFSSSSLIEINYQWGKFD